MAHRSPLCTELVPVEGNRQSQERTQAAGIGRFGLEAMPGRVLLVAALSTAVASVRLAGGNRRTGEPQPV